MVADGDKVVTRWTNRGTHRAEWMGAAPTGRQVTYTGISNDRIVAGRVVETWRNSD
jgi:predicted ester cyclase